MIRADWQEALRMQRAIKELGDKKLLNAMRKAIRDVARPVGEEVRAAGAAAMPNKGGLAARVARARVGVSASGNEAKITLTNRSATNGNMGQFEAGLIRHPVFGHRKVWVEERVPAHVFSTEFGKHADKVLKAVESEIQKAFEGLPK